MTAADMGVSVREGIEPDQETLSLVEDLDNYLRSFAKPIREGDGTSWLFSDAKCISCGVSLGGMLGSFVWGIAHGEGNCSRCGWPTRYYHRIVDRNGKPIFEPAIVQILLQYHPDDVRRREDSDNEQ